jgi:hypothetical protein
MVTNPTSGISYWIRSSFSNSSTAFSVSPDIVGSTLISAPIVGVSQYAMMNGAIVINNTSSTAKHIIIGKKVAVCHLEEEVQILIDLLQQIGAKILFTEFRMWINKYSIIRKSL